MPKRTFQFKKGYKYLAIFCIFAIPAIYIFFWFLRGTPPNLMNISGVLLFLSLYSSLIILTTKVSVDERGIEGYFLFKKTYIGWDEKPNVEKGRDQFRFWKIYTADKVISVASSIEGEKEFLSSVFQYTQSKKIEEYLRKSYWSLTGYQKIGIAIGLSCVIAVLIYMVLQHLVNGYGLIHIGCPAQGGPCTDLANFTRKAYPYLWAFSIFNIIINFSIIYPLIQRRDEQQKFSRNLTEILVVCAVLLLLVATVALYIYLNPTRLQFF